MASVQPVMNGESLDAILQCPICFDIFEEPRVFNPCQHMFCLKCIISFVDNALKNHETGIPCPLCRTSLNTEVDFFRMNERNDWKICFPRNLVVSQLMDTLKSEDEYCKIHQNKLNEHVCVNHSEMFCSDCLREYHRNCRNVQSIKEYTPKYLQLIRNDIELLQEESDQKIKEVEKHLHFNDNQLGHLVNCRTKLDKAIDLIMENNSIALAKMNEYADISSADIKHLEELTGKSKDIYTHLKCQIELSASKKKLTEEYDAIVTKLKSTDAKKLLSEIKCELTSKMTRNVPSQARSNQKNKQKQMYLEEVTKPEGSQSKVTQKQVRHRPKTSYPHAISLDSFEDPFPQSTSTFSTPESVRRSLTFVASETNPNLASGSPQAVPGGQLGSSFASVQRLDLDSLTPKSRPLPPIKQSNNWN